MEEPPSVVVDGADEKATTSNGSTKSLNGSSNSPQHERKLTMWALVFMTYFAVCGGPYGLEDAVGAGYPFFMILGMVIVRIPLFFFFRKKTSVLLLFFCSFPSPYAVARSPLVAFGAFSLFM
jgi:hypothetical protein